jgi:hypothetical protein
MPISRRIILGKLLSRRFIHDVLLVDCEKIRKTKSGNNENIFQCRIAIDVRNQNFLSKHSIRPTRSWHPNTGTTCRFLSDERFGDGLMKQGRDLFVFENLDQGQTGERKFLEILRELATMKGAA